MANKDSSLENFLSKAASFTEEIDKLKKRYRDLSTEKQQYDGKLNELSENLFALINTLQVFQKDVISKLSDYKMELQGKEAELEKTKQQTIKAKQEESIKNSDFVIEFKKPKIKEKEVSLDDMKTEVDFDIEPKKKKKKADFDLDDDFPVIKEKKKVNLDLDDDFPPIKEKKRADFDLDDDLPPIKKKSKEKDDEIYLFDLQ